MKTKLNLLAPLAVAVATLSIQTGCAVVMATKQPEKKNLAVLEKGIPRALLLAELGAPISSEVRDGKKLDVFYFTQGYNKGTKISRVALHATMDVFTLGVWELVGTPTEIMLDGNKMLVQVTYDESDHVEDVFRLGE